MALPCEYLNRALLISGGCCSLRVFVLYISGLATISLAMFLQLRPDFVTPKAKTFVLHEGADLVLLEFRHMQPLSHSACLTNQ